MSEKVLTDCLKELGRWFNYALNESFLQDPHERIKAYTAFGMFTKSLESPVLGNSAHIANIDTFIYRTTLRILNKKFPTKADRQTPGAIFCSLGDIELDFLDHISGLVLLCFLETKTCDSDCFSRSLVHQLQYINIHDLPLDITSRLR